MVVTEFELPELFPTPQDDLGCGYGAYITKINLLGLGGVFSSLSARGNLVIATKKLFVECGSPGSEIGMDIAAGWVEVSGVALSCSLKLPQLGHVESTPFIAL